MCTLTLEHSFEEHILSKKERRLGRKRMEEEDLDLPKCFRFVPKDAELMEFYVKPHILGQPISRFRIPERHIYGDNSNPWDVFGPELLNGKFKEQGGVYVFVRLHRKKKKSFCYNKNKKEDDDDYLGKNFERIAGCGTWDGKTHKPIMEDGVVVGVKRSLVFEMFDTDDNRRRLLLDPPHYWTIHEYSVPYGFPNPCDVVLCHVSVDYSKRAKIKKGVFGRKMGREDGGCLDQKKNKTKRKSRVADDSVGTSGCSGVDEQAFVSSSTSCCGGVGGRKEEDDGGLRNTGKEIMMMEETRGSVVIIHDDEEALGLTSYDEEANDNGLGMVRLEQNHCVGPLASTSTSCCGVEGPGSFMSLMLQQENYYGIVGTEFQLECDAYNLGGDGSFQAMQDSFRPEEVNGCGVGCAVDYQVNMDSVGKDVVECNGEKNLQGFQEKYCYDNFDMDELVNYLYFCDIPAPVLYENADEQLQCGGNCGGELVEEQNKDTNDVTELSRKRKCEVEDFVVTKKFCWSH